MRLLESMGNGIKMRTAAAAEAAAAVEAAAEAVDWEKQGRCWFVSPLFHRGCPWQESKTMPLSNVSLRMLLKKFEAHKNAGVFCLLCFMLRISLLHFRQNRGKNGG